MEHLAPIHIPYKSITRRKFLKTASVFATGIAMGCAVNPVTGENQFMLISEDSEIKIDQENSPCQFSADYGLIQDKKLHNYIGRTGKSMAKNTHRPNLPYSIQGVNATYVNAYAFPGGSIGITRGILLSLENEAELGALIGHELGHVNARHTARQMSNTMLTQTVIGGVSTYVGTIDPAYASLSSQLGMLGAGALLASYSRDNEREADDLGIMYMVKSGYSPAGFEGLMDMLRNLSKHKPNAIELMFSTHPMSDERYKTAIKAVSSKYATYKTKPLFRERYMDNTAGLRKISGAIFDMQKGDKEIASGNYDNAEGYFQKALKKAPNDYAGLLMMAKCQMVKENLSNAARFADKARKVYPNEAQACNINGFIKLKKKKYSSALKEFNHYNRLLPGNPHIGFFIGYCFEGMGNRKAAAEKYYEYLQVVNSGENVKHAYRRLFEWGYIKES